MKKLVIITIVAVLAMTGVASALSFVTFKDVSAENVHRDNINRAQGEQITVGCASERFCPDQNVKRDQMATFLVNLLDRTREDNEILEQRIDALEGPSRGPRARVLFRAPNPHRPRPRCGRVAGTKPTWTLLTNTTAPSRSRGPPQVIDCDQVTSRSGPPPFRRGRRGEAGGRARGGRSPC